MRQGVDTFIVRIMSSSQHGHPTLSTGDRTENATLNGDISISEKNKEIKAKNERFDGRDLEAATTGVVAVDDTAPGGMSEMERKQIEAGNPNIVDWEPNDPGNPLNWSSSRKWFNMGTVGLMCFVSPFASTLPAPALPTIAHNFRITNSSVAALCISIFILAYAFGPLVASPASELYGRAPVYKAFFVIFFLFNIGSALAKNTTQFILCRFFAGIGGSAAITVAAGSSVDLFRSEQRGAAMSTVSLGPLLAPIIAPVIGGFMAERLNVSWSLWLLSILSGLVMIFSFVFVHETNPEVLLRRRVHRMRHETGNEKLISIYDVKHGEKTAREVFFINMSRAIVLFFTDPSCMMIGIYMAIVYGYLYLLFVTFGYIFTLNYGQSTEIAGLHYIAPGIGQLLGAAFASIAMDKIFITLKKRHNGEGRPEFRVPLMFIASILMPAGLFIYGWCGKYHTHWIALDIGVMIFGFGTIVCFLALNTYLLDAFTYAASAVAATTVIRSIAGALFPLFGQAMFDKLGLGWGNSLLAFIALVLGTVYPIFLWYYGPAIRASGKSER